MAKPTLAQKVVNTTLCPFCGAKPGHYCNAGSPIGLVPAEASHLQRFVAAGVRHTEAQIRKRPPPSSYAVVLEVACPTCGEPAGMKCLTRNGRRAKRNESHSTRMGLAGLPGTHPAREKYTKIWRKTQRKRAAILEVACPACGEPAGMKCLTRTGRRIKRTESHSTRSKSQ